MQYFRKTIYVSPDVIQWLWKFERACLCVYVFFWRNAFFHIASPSFATQWEDAEEYDDDNKWAEEYRDLRSFAWMGCFLMFACIPFAVGGCDSKYWGVRRKYLASLEMLQASVYLSSHFFKALSSLFHEPIHVNTPTGASVCAHGWKCGGAHAGHSRAAGVPCVSVLDILVSP